eukprot:IDg6618t1
MCSQGVIEPSQSEWASPVVLVPMSDGSLRFCVDCRRLNALNVKDSYPLPRMDDCLDSLGKAAFFSTLECNSGYWQIPVSEPDRPKTAFTSHAGTFQFRRMPFGICNAPATFQRTLDILLAGYRWQSCLVYLDDVIVFSNTFKDHIRHVEQVLKALDGAGFSLKFRSATQPLIEEMRSQGSKKQTWNRKSLRLLEGRPGHSSDPSDIASLLALLSRHRCLQEPN